MQNESEFKKWVQLLAEVICDFLFLALWLSLAWVIHEGINQILPLHGLPYYAGYLIEAVLDISTLYKLIRLRLRVHRNRDDQWWR